ncbi:MAG: ABC transporter permease [Bacteroidales bacterium]|nr:ABC transporter permease [Bacteroidales bacterium]
MNKIILIIQREYLARVRNKTFIILTLLAPVLMAGFIAVIVYLSTLESDKSQTILVNDHSNLFKESLSDTKNIKFTFADKLNDDMAKKLITEGNYTALLIIPDSIQTKRLNLISENQVNIGTKMYITKQIEKKLRHDKLKSMGVDPDIIDEVNPEISIRTIKINKEGKEEISSAEAALGIGYIASFLIYMFIFIYGAMVMRGVIEEKTNRVVEIIISSVKPFQLMMGKIIGVALVAFTQLALWITFGIIIMFAAQSFMGDTANVQEQMIQTQGMSPEVQAAMNNTTFNDIMTPILNLPIALILFSFVFYFIGGYLLYSSLFAAIGGAVDNETDTQQFMLPITIPLILSLIVAQTVMQNPEGPVAFWFSVIPFTSPVVMMMRVAYGVPEWELILSMLLLVLAFIGTTWLAAKIYRIGILIYGKKFSYKDLWMWLKFKG